MLTKTHQLSTYTQESEQKCVHVNQLLFQLWNILMESAHLEVEEEQRLQKDAFLGFSRRWVEAERLLHGTRPVMLQRKNDNEMYRGEDYTIHTLPLV